MQDVDVVANNFGHRRHTVAEELGVAKVVPQDDDELMVHGTISPAHAVHIEVLSSGKLEVVKQRKNIVHQVQEQVEGLAE